MFKRKIYNQLVEWKQSLTWKKKALLIKGLRQVGKTTIVKEFCKNNYENIIYFNFANEQSAKIIFNGDFDVDQITRSITALKPDAKFVPDKTVLIFDEVQDCPRARSCVKAFAEDGRYDIIETGSLIGLRGYNRKHPTFIPTGFETILYMYPMDFEEFLWAIGVNLDSIELIKESFIENKYINPAVNAKFMSYFKDYLIVGGMPEVVDLFIKSNDFNQVYNMQNFLLESFKDDFGKHLDESGNKSQDKLQLNKIIDVYNSIPQQLAKKNKKFMFADIKQGARSRDYKEALNWLEEFGLVKFCYNINCLQLPLVGNKIDNCFKVYIVDTGLFIAMLEKGIAFNILKGDLKQYKGAIYENIIADAFIKMGKPLFYYRKETKAEIDFVTSYKTELALIEVKSTNGKAKSLKEVIKEDSTLRNNFKLIDGNMGEGGAIKTIPLYMAFLIR